MKENSMKQVVDVLRRLEAAGVEMYISDRHNHHGLDAEDVPRLLNDPEAFFADLNGVTRQQWIDFNEADGRARCSATTKRGTRCKFEVAGSSRYWSVRTWVEAQGGRCKLHGGDDD